MSTDHHQPGCPLDSDPAFYTTDMVCTCPKKKPELTLAEFRKHKDEAEQFIAEMVGAAIRQFTEKTGIVPMGIDIQTVGHYVDRKQDALLILGVNLDMGNL